MYPSHNTPQQSRSRSAICLNRNGIKIIVDKLKQEMGTDKIFVMGRAAEVIRGLFLSAHVLQVFMMDESEHQTQLLETNTNRWYIKKPDLYRDRDDRLAAFGFVHAHRSCVLYAQSSMNPSRQAEFLHLLEKEGMSDKETGLKIPSFNMNFEFWNNNSFYHEETTLVMESVYDYLHSSIGKKEDIPLIGDMHRYLALPEDKRDPDVFMNINERLQLHEHGELLSRVFKETSAETI